MERDSTSGRRGMVLRLLVLLLLAAPALANYPLFDVATRMRVLLVPRDAAVGAVIYRLRATDSDFDYPLHFDVGGDGAGAQVAVVRLDNLPCTRNMSYCQANVVLARKLDAGRVYDVRLRVRDSRGDATSIDAIVQLSNNSTPVDATFPRRPTLVMVPEDTKPGTELDYVIVRKNPRNSRHAIVELWGSPLFTLAQRLSSRTDTNASIILAGPLDYETQAMYTLDLYALDPFVEPGQDTRNIAGFQVAVVVVDVQDTPPEFIEAPPVTQLSPTLQVGDEVVRVRAEDGDKGKPRQIRYGLVSEGSPFTTFFTVDERTGGY
ncbi:cadherin-86C-like [Frankliniella occidentalis]|uniref:Cadherin-86C-like n=1 Tax=Frankliniella occidentalis TaxID=133901 RepID=A0A9C6X520_FRAOC|nr:cadherin-86C-like [Frankliniella occidentalis]